MRPNVTDRVAWYVGLMSDTVAAKRAESIEMPFGLRTRLSPGNDVLDGVHIPYGKG